MILLVLEMGAGSCDMLRLLAPNMLPNKLEMYLERVDEEAGLWAPSTRTMSSCLWGDEGGD